MDISLSTAGLALAGFVGFLLESIFGFGGTIIFLAVAGFFHDFKTLILISMFTGVIASSTVLLQSWHRIDWATMGRIGLLTLPGILVGTLLLEQLHSTLLLKIFAGLLVLYGALSLLGKTTGAPHWLQSGFVLLGGFIQGVFTIGGPFILMGYRDRFADKSVLRGSMAVFFCLANLLRLGLSSATNPATIPTITAHAWIALPIIAGVLLGWLIHVRIPERVFKHAMTLGLMLIGVVLLLR